MGDRRGAGELVRLVLRRDRVRVVVWTVSVVALVAASAAAIAALFPTQALLDQAAVASAGDASVIVFNGPPQGLDTIGGEVAFQSGSAVLVAVALMSLLAVVRSTRAEEESGRAELVRAARVGRHAAGAAVGIVVAVWNAVIGALVASVLILQGLPVAGSLCFGASCLAIGVFFGSVAMVTAQVTQSSRVASGLAGVVLGVAFALRAAGDVGDGRLSWLSPIGWSQKTRPFAGEQWWPLLVPLVLTAVLLAVARRLADRRDLGAGLIPTRPGPPVASPALRRSWGLAARLERATLTSWTAGMFLVGVGFGSVANAVGGFVGDNSSLRAILAQSAGRSLVDSYLGTALLLMAIIASGCAVQSTARLRAEETTGHAEAVLASRLSRVRWMNAHLMVAVLGSALVLVAAGLGTAIPYAVITHDAGQLPRLLGDALIYLPAECVTVGITATLFGLIPRATAAAWVAVGAFFIVGFFGQLLKLPNWAMDLSPFHHTPQAPAVAISVSPLLGIITVAIALLAAGLLGFRHRDLT